MPARDLPLIPDAVRAAGEVALRYTGPSARRWDKPGNAGPVTEADLAVNDTLHSQLRGARADYGWLSEESDDDPDRLNRDAVFIIDPIDGTRSYVEGGRTWAIAVAVADQGLITAAAVYLPMRDMLFAAALGEGASLNEEPLRVSQQQSVTGARVLAARPNFDARHWHSDVPAVDRHYRPSLAYRLALVGTGRFDAMVTLRPSWEWDIAAGSLIVAEAGGRVTDRMGEPLRFNQHRPQHDGVVAGTTPVQSALIAALRPGTARAG
ncbi:MAG: 3'(2'),5'-bisphosphate nucleotidase CysQ [Pseudomonadota bacterium]